MLQSITRITIFGVQVVSVLAIGIVFKLDPVSNELLCLGEHFFTRYSRLILHFCTVDLELTIL